MNLVICTGLGLLVLVAIIAVFGGAMIALALGCNWADDHFHWTMPAFLEKYLWIVLATFVSLPVLLVAHQVGCKVIHLTARH